MTEKEQAHTTEQRTVGRIHPSTPNEVYSDIKAEDILDVCCKTSYGQDIILSFQKKKEVKNATK